MTGQEGGRADRAVPEAPFADAHFSPCRTWRYSLTREILDPAIGCLDEDERGGTAKYGAKP